MGVDFVRSRESHLTIAHDAVYRSIFKVIESESLAVGDRVIVEFTNGMYDQCIVVTTDPLSLAQYKPKRYIREDVLYRGTFIPEHLRKGVVSDNAATGDGTGTGDEGSSVDSEGNVGEDGSVSGDDEFHGEHNECSCPSGCPHCKDCGKSMIGHWGYEHLYCHCWDDPEQDDTGEDAGGDGGGSGDSGDDQDTSKPCHCPHHCRFCVCPKRPDSTTGLPDELNPVMLECPDEILEGETVSCKVKLLKVSDHDVDVEVSSSPSLASIPDTVTVPAGELESSFEFVMGGEDLEIYAGVLCEFTASVRSKSLSPDLESMTLVSGDTIGQPFRVEIRLSKPATEIMVISVSSEADMVIPENVVIMSGEQTKGFVVVPFEEGSLTATLNGSSKILDILPGLP